MERYVEFKCKNKARGYERTLKSKPVRVSIGQMMKGGTLLKCHYK